MSQRPHKTYVNKLNDSFPQPNARFLRFYATFELLWMLCYFSFVNGLQLLFKFYPPPLRVMNLFLPGQLLYRFYTCYIVIQYAIEIEFENHMKSSFRNLSDEEIERFVSGVDSIEEREELSIQEIALTKSYDKQKYEIDKERLDLANSATLGCGEFGHVYKVNLLPVYTEKEMPAPFQVAVKTVDPTLSDVYHFTALLTEAKVMTFLGKHENIVRLIGICTSEIRLRTS